MTTPPGYEERKNEVLRSRGVQDPESYDIMPNGVVRRRVTAPQAKPVPTPEGPGALSTFGRSLAGGIPEAIVGTGGAALGASIGAPLGPIGVIGGALIGGFSGAYAGGKAEEALAPQAWKDFTSAGREEHPMAAFLGDIASEGITMRPGLRPIAQASRMFRTGMKATPAQIESAMNVGLGSAIGGGTGLARELMDDEEGVNFKRLAAEVAAGGLFNTPTRIGRAVSFGKFQPDTVDKLPEDFVARSTEDPNTVTPNAAAGKVDRGWNKNAVSALDNLGLRSVYGIRTDDDLGKFFKSVQDIVQMPEKSRTGKRVALDKKIRQMEDSLPLLDAQGRAATEAQIAELKLNRRLFDDAFKFKGLVDEFEAGTRFDQQKALPAPPEARTGQRPIINVTPTVARPRLIGPERQLPAPPPPKVAQPLARVTPAAVQAPAPDQRAAEIAAATEQQRVARGVEQALGPEAYMASIAGNFRRPEASPETFRANMRVGKGNAANAAESAADLEARRIEADLAGESRPRYQDTATPEQPRMTAAEMAGATEYGRAKQATKVRFRENVTRPDGTPVRGRNIGRPTPVDLALADVSTKYGTPDTPWHELLHQFIRDVKSHGSPKEKKLVETMLRAVDGDEEKLVQAGGVDFYNRMFDKKSNSFLRDVSDAIRTRFGSKNPDVAARQLSAGMRYGAGAAERGLGPDAVATGAAKAGAASGESEARYQPLDESQNYFDDNRKLSGKADMRRTISTLINQQGELGKVEVRELTQNSIDALYKKAATGDTDLKIAQRSDGSRLGMADNAHGMSPNFLAKGFLQLSVTGKDVGEGGGFGLAKAVMYGRAEKFKVRSLWIDPATKESYLSILRGTRDSLVDTQYTDKPNIAKPKGDIPAIYDLANGLTLEVRRVDNPHGDTGTIVDITYPEDSVQWFDGDAYRRSLSYNQDIKRSYLYTDKYGLTDRELANPLNAYAESGDKFFANDSVAERSALIEGDETYKALETREFPNATVTTKLSLSPDADRDNSIYYDVYSNGMWQFSGWVDVQDSAQYPRYHFDIKSKVPANSPDYPIKLDRNSVLTSIDSYFKQTLKDAANTIRQQKLDAYKTAERDAVRIETASGERLLLDVSKEIPKETLALMAQDPTIVNMVELSQAIHDTIREALHRRYPNKGYALGQFKGFLTGTSEAYGVRFGSSEKNSKGDIYYDPFLMIQKLIDESGEMSPDILMRKYIATHVGVSVHELSHQHIHSEGEALARELTFTLGTALLDNPRLYEIYQKAKQYRHEGLAIERWTMDTARARVNNSGNSFLADLKDVAGRRASQPSDQIMGRVDDDARYQPLGPAEHGLTTKSPRKSRNIFSSAVEHLRAMGTPETKYVADGMDKLYARARNYRGRYITPIAEATAQLNDKQKRTLLEELYNERDGSRLAGPTRAAFAAVRRVMGQIADDQIAAGQRVVTPSGNFRTRKKDPKYFPNIINHDALRILTERHGTAEFNRLRKDFVDYNTARGVKNADEIFARLANALNKSDRPRRGGIEFNALRVVESSKLPPSWMETDLDSLLRRYVDRVSKDRAWFDIVEADERMAALIGEDMYMQDKPINKAAYKPIGGVNEVRQLVDSFRGENFGDDQLIRSVGRLVNALILSGPKTRLTDLATTPIKALTYAPTGERLRVLTKSLGDLVNNWAGVRRTAMSTGFIRPGDQIVRNEILGMGERTASGLDRVSEGVVKYTGAEAIERGSRVVAQAMGEAIGVAYKERALRGDKRALAFLDKVGPDWRTVNDAELGTRIGQLFQGKYDATNLPRWALESDLAPFMAMMRWNVEQWNNFKKFAIGSLREGDPAMLIAQVLAGVVGGLGVAELREAISGRPGYTATWGELAEAPDKQRAMEELVAKMAEAAQVTGTVGIVGEIMKQVLDVSQGKLPQGARYPVVSVASDVGARIMSAADAIIAGEDLLSVVTQMSADITRANVQAIRFLEEQSARVGGPGADKREKSVGRRNYQMFNRLAGYDTAKPQTGVPAYRRLSERRFDEEKDLRKAGQMARELTTRAVERAEGDPSKLTAELRKLRTSQITFAPSVQNDPVRFRRYLDFVERTRGPEAKEKLLRDYSEAARLRAAKAAMVPR